MDLEFRIRCLVITALACLFALSGAAAAQAAPVQSNGETCGEGVCGLAISKSGDAVSVDNAPEHFTYTVTSTGISPVTVDKATGVADDKCSPVVFDSGDTNDNGMVDSGESWTFHCDTTVNHADENASHDIVNTATVTGTIGYGACGCQQRPSATTTFTTHVVHPSIAVTKTGSPNPVNQGATINYTITATNTGDIELTAVTVTDPKCDNVTPSGSFTLAPGASKTLTCTHVTTASDGASYTNQVCVSGVATPGGTVSKCAEVTTTITPPAPGTTSAPVAAPPAATPPPPAQVVLGQRVTPGSARLVGPSGCVAKVFTLRVRGTKIARAVFTLDGKVVAVRTSSQTFSLTINPAKFKVGVHHVVVRVTFEAGSGTKAKTLRLAFQRCSRALRAPRFTG